MTHLTLIHDSRSEEAMLVATERHSGIVYRTARAVERAIMKANTEETETHGAAHLTSHELANGLANMLGSVLGERGISREDFVTALYGEWTFWEEPKPEAPAKKGESYDQ